MKSKAKISVLVFVALLALLSGVDLLVRLSYAAGLVLGLGYLFARLNVRAVEVKTARDTERLQVGKWFEQEITVRNADILPKFLVEVRVNGHLPGQDHSRVLSLLPRQSACWRARTKCEMRGHYIVDAPTVASEDFFSLFSRQRHVGQPASLIVHPATVELPGFLSASSDNGRRHSYDWSDQIPLNVSGIRDYLAGDRLRHIHWLRTARTGRLMVKDMRPDSSDEVWIVLDLNRAVQAGSGPQSTEEYGVTIAASVAKKCLDAGLSVGLIASGECDYLFPAQKGGHDLWDLLDMLAQVRAWGSLPLADVVAAKAEVFGAHSTLVLITPSYADLDAVALDCLGRRSGRSIGILLEPCSFGGTPMSSQAGAVLAAGSRVETYVVRQGDDIAGALSGRHRVPV